MELISKEEAMRLLKEDLDASRSRGDDERAETCLLHFIEISNLPTIEERKEGHWIKHFDEAFPGDSTIECSVCHEEQYTTIDDYFCPNCGAKMKGE